MVNGRTRSIVNHGKRLKGSRGLLTLVVVGLVLGIIVMSVCGQMGLSWTETGDDTGSVYTATLVPYKDGVPVSEPIVMGAFTEGGNPIDSFVITISWTSVGDLVDWTTFELDGEFSVTVIMGQDATADVVEFFTTFTSLKPNGNWVQTVVCGTDICLPANGKLTNAGYVWELRFNGLITGSAVENGVRVFDSLPFVGYATVSSDAVGFGMDGSMTGN